MKKFSRLALVAGLSLGATMSISTVAPAATLFGSGGTTLSLVLPGNSAHNFGTDTANGGGYYYTFTTDHAYRLNLQTIGTLGAINVITPFTLETGSTPGGTVLGTSTAGAYAASLSTVIAAGTYNLSVAGTTVNEAITGNASVAAVPEPAAWALMMLGIGGIGLCMRRTRKTTLALAAV